MCIAIAQPAGSRQLTTEEIRNGWSHNEDGGGYAFVRDGNITIRKSMELERFITMYLEDVAEYGDSSDFIIHMRLATHGKPNVGTTHPFKTTPTTAFAHNGIISALTPLTDDKHSDSMVLNEFILQGLPVDWMDRPAMVELVSEYIDGDKLVIISTGKHTDRTFYIINEQSGEWDNGLWFSNASCQRASRYIYQNDAYTAWWENSNVSMEEAYQARSYLTPRTEVQRLMEGDFILREELVEQAKVKNFCEDCFYTPCMCMQTCAGCYKLQDSCYCAGDFFSVEELVYWCKSGNETELTKDKTFGEFLETSPK